MPIKPVDPKDPEDYLAQIDEPRRSDIEALDKLIRKEGPNLKRQLAYGMLAYGSIRYRSKTGREGDWFVVALASQKRYISLYVSCATEDGYVAESYRDLLPKADIGKSCVRFKRLSDVDEGVLRVLVREAAGIFERDPDFAVMSR